MQALSCVAGLSGCCMSSGPHPNRPALLLYFAFGSKTRVATGITAAGTLGPTRPAPRRRASSFARVQHFTLRRMTMARPRTTQDYEPHRHEDAEPSNDDELSIEE